MVVGNIRENVNNRNLIGKREEKYFSLKVDNESPIFQPQYGDSDI